jgi:hypothetical protein
VRKASDHGIFVFIDPHQVSVELLFLELIFHVLHPKYKYPPTHSTRHSLTAHRCLSVRLFVNHRLMVLVLVLAIYFCNYFLLSVKRTCGVVGRVATAPLTGPWRLLVLTWPTWMPRELPSHTRSMLVLLLLLLLYAVVVAKSASSSSSSHPHHPHHQSPSTAKLIHHWESRTPIQISNTNKTKKPLHNNTYDKQHAPHTLNNTTTTRATATLCPP